MPELETLPPEHLDEAASTPQSRSARMRRLGIGLGAATLAVAAIVGGSVALWRGTATNAAVSQPLPSAEEAMPSSTAVQSPIVGPASVATSPTTARPTTTAPASTTRAGAPAYVDGVPQVKVSPSQAKVGARVRVEGHGFTGEQWAAPNAPLWLAHDGGCGLYAQAEHTLRVTAGGRLAGELTVPARGECRQSDRGDEPVVAGRYRIAFSCTACFVGELKVIGSPPSVVSCRNVAFTPNSDDVASSIVARNLPCSEAEALVRKVGGPLGFNGAASARADGFRCVRTGQEDRALPMAAYQCTNGPKQVTFTRT